MFSEVPLSETGGSQDLGQTVIIQKWWDYVADIMRIDPDHTSVSIPLEEVYYME